MRAFLLLILLCVASSRVGASEPQDACTLRWQLRLLKQQEYELAKPERDLNRLGQLARESVNKTDREKKAARLAREKRMLLPSELRILKQVSSELKAAGRDSESIALDSPLAAPPQKSKTPLKALVGKRKLSFSFEDGAEYRILYHVNEEGKAVVDRIATRETVY